MVGAVNLIRFFWTGVLLLGMRTGSVGGHPVMLFYNSGQPQNQLRNSEMALVMPAQTFVDQSPAQDRMDESDENGDNPDQESSSIFTFPPPPPLWLPIFQQVQPYRSSNNNTNNVGNNDTLAQEELSVKRMTRMINPSQNFGTPGMIQGMGESSGEAFWNFPGMEGGGMFRFSPPFLIPPYASLPPPTQGSGPMTPPPGRPHPQQFTNSQPNRPPISYQIPILNNGYQHQPQGMGGSQYFTQSPQTNPAPQPQWQVQPLSPELEAAIFGQYSYKQPQSHQQPHPQFQPQPQPQPQPQSYQQPHPQFQPQPQSQQQQFQPQSHPQSQQFSIPVPLTMSFPTQPQGYFPHQHQQSPLPHPYPLPPFFSQVPPMMSMYPAPPLPPPPAQLENYDKIQSTPKVPVAIPASASIPTTTQYPLTRSLDEPRPELLSTTTPTPGTTTPLVEDPAPNYGYNTYASSYRDYSKEAISIQKFDHVIAKDGYSLAFKTENGIDSREEGHLKTVLKSDGQKANVYSPASESKLGVVHVKSGQVSWTSPECITFTLRYEADERGYRPSIQESPASNLDCLQYGKNFKFGSAVNSYPPK